MKNRKLHKMKGTLKKENRKVYNLIGRINKEMRLPYGILPWDMVNCIQNSNQCLRIRRSDRERFLPVILFCQKRGKEGTA